MGCGVMLGISKRFAKSIFRHFLGLQERFVLAYLQRNIPNNRKRSSSKQNMAVVTENAFKSSKI